MADSRFFTKSGPFTLEQIASSVGATIQNGDTSEEYLDVAPLESAASKDVSFFENPRYKQSLASTAAGAIIIAPSMVDLAPKGASLLVSDAPYVAYAGAALMFYPHLQSSEDAKISPSAHVDPSAKIGTGTSIEPGAVIGPNVEIGDGSYIGANAVIGRGVKIGKSCSIAANVTLSHALVGDRVIVHPGARIGQDGFGFAMGPNGHQKIPQLGRVVLQDDVDIGANTTIDRGAGPDTIIGEGSKIDNQVQLAHNVSVGRRCVIVSQVGISGSAKLGNNVIAGGQVGIAGHLEIGDGAMLAARTGVPSDLAGGQQYGGTPARPISQWRRELAAVAILAKRKKKKK